MNRIASIDFFKLIASFFIVCIHTKTVSKIDGFEKDSFSFVIDNVARFAVPFFFVTSGFLIDFTNWEKLWKKLKTVALLYIVWSIVFGGIRSVFNVPYPEFHFVDAQCLNAVANFFLQGICIWL